MIYPPRLVAPQALGLTKYTLEAGVLCRYAGAIFDGAMVVEKG